MTVDVRDSIFHALSTDLEVEAFSGSIARIPIGYSDYNPAKVVDTSAGDAAVVAGAGTCWPTPASSTALPPTSGCVPTRR